jgi:hypothetical protein
MKTLAPTRSSLEHIPSLAEPAQVRFGRGSTAPTFPAPMMSPPERPTSPLDVTDLIQLLDIASAVGDGRDTRRIEAKELRSLGVIEAGELPSIAWAKASRVSDLDDRHSPTTIIDLADPPSRPLHHELSPAVLVVEIDDPSEDVDITDDANEVELTFALGAQAITRRTPISGFLVGIAVGLASVAAAFTALGVLGH